MGFSRRRWVHVKNWTRVRALVWISHDKRQCHGGVRNYQVLQAAESGVLETDVDRPVPWSAATVWRQIKWAYVFRIKLRFSHFFQQINNKICRMTDYVNSLLWMCFSGCQVRVESVEAMLTVLLRNVGAKWNLWARCDEIKCKDSEYENVLKKYDQHQQR